MKFEIEKVENGFILRELGPDLGTYVFTDFTCLMNFIAGIWKVCRDDERVVFLGPAKESDPRLAQLNSNIPQWKEKG